MKYAVEDMMPGDVFSNYGDSKTVFLVIATWEHRIAVTDLMMVQYMSMGSQPRLFCSALWYSWTYDLVFRTEKKP